MRRTDGEQHKGDREEEEERDHAHITAEGGNTVVALREYFSVSHHNN